RGVGELGAGELHAVAGVAAEPDRDRIEFLDGGRRAAAGVAGRGRCPRGGGRSAHEGLAERKINDHLVPSLYYLDARERGSAAKKVRPPRFAASGASAEALAPLAAE